MEVYLSLGSNIGNRLLIIRSALERIGENPFFSDIVVSRLYLTEAIGFFNQRDFMNCALRLETELSAQELLREINKIEEEFGRRREIKWGPRTLDIDIIFYGDRIVQEPELIIPHPEMHKRRFVLQPLTELCPGFIHPVLKRTIKILYQRYCEDFAVSEDYRHFLLEREQL
jgi:2-amino-4-hydroxy-6-hydroxymethyldihydropteridine diphosphokinase